VTATFAVVAPGGEELTSGRLALRSPPDLSAVDGLARLQLAARRLGWAIEVRDPGAELAELLELVGLRVEMLGQAEGGEEVGVEERVEPRDPPV